MRLKNIMENEYSVIGVTLVSEVLHLDCVLSVPRDRLATVCDEAFLKGIPEPIKDWDLIKVSMSDVQRLSVNGVPVDRHDYILSYNSHNDNRYIQNELE